MHQELATAHIEGLETKCFVLNNQHLGMVMQWEDRFYKGNRAHTYLGKKVRRGAEQLCHAERRSSRRSSRRGAAAE